MKKQIHIFIISVVLIFFAKQGKAQESNLLKELRIPQILQENPGALLPYNGHVSFPALGRIQMNFIFPFNYGDLFTISTQNIKKMKRNLMLENNMQLDIIHFGFRAGKKNYISVTSAIKTNVHFAVRRDLLLFLVEGNAPYEGKTLSFLNNDFFSVDAYAEIGAGYNRQVNEKLSWGVNVKYLLGLANAYSNKAELDLYTEPRFEKLTLNYSLDSKLSTVFNIDKLIERVKAGKTEENQGDNVEIDYSDIFQNLKNHGFALDVGARYRINKRVEVNASVLDIGFIKWQTNPKQCYIKDASFSFSGFGYDDLFDENGNVKEVDAEAYFKKIGDSLSSAAVSNIESSASYRKWLNAKINIGGSFYINEKNHVNAVFNGYCIRNRFIPSGTVSITSHVGKWFDVTVGNTFRQNAFFNPGMGLNFTGGVIQLYMVVNYVNSFYIDRLQNINFAFGINFVAPQKKDKNSIPSDTE
jgi:virulence-associated protein VapD